MESQSVKPLASPFDSPGERRARAEKAAGDVWVGRRIGKYEIRHRLGEGGMGVVYRARDTVLRRDVAIKLLPDVLSADPASRKRFLREAQAAARLNHPNLVAVLDVEQREGTFFLVMELVSGGSAQDALRVRGAFAWPLATWIATRACRGLVAAHAAGLVHRDVKPSNVLLGPDGMVKLADFGLAKVADLSAASLTGTGRVLGTPHYMSPEQCRAEEADECSDVYSLGATYYALLTGRPPYPLDVPVQVMFAHCSRPIPDPRTKDASMPAACATLLRKAMAKRRDERHGSAAAMLADLEAILAAAGPVAPVFAPVEPTTENDRTGSTSHVGSSAQARSHTVPVRRARRRTRWKRWFVGLGAIVLLGLVGAAIALWPPRPEGSPTPDRWETLTAAATEATRSKDPALLRAVLADVLAHRDDLARTPGSPSPHEDRAIGSLVDRLRCLLLFEGGSDAQGKLLAAGGKVSGLAWSPDHRWLAAGSSDGEGGVRIWDGTSPLPTASLGTGTGKGKGGWGPSHAVVFSPNGQLVSGQGTGRVRFYDPRTREENSLSLGLPGDLVAGLAFCPDGRLLAARLENTSRQTRGSVKVWDVRTRKEVYRLPSSTLGTIGMDFSPAPAGSLATCGAGGLVRLWDRDTGKWQRDLPTGLTFAASLSFDSTGKTLVVAGYHRDLEGVNARGLCFLDVASGKPLGPLLQTAQIRAVTYAPWGGLVASGSVSQASLWDSLQRRELVSLGKPTSVQTCGQRFSPGGGVLAVATAPAGVTLWDVRRYHELSTAP